MRFSLKQLFLWITIAAVLLFGVLRLNTRQWMMTFFVLAAGAYVVIVLRAAIGSPRPLGFKIWHKVAFWVIVTIGAIFGSLLGIWTTFFAFHHREVYYGWVYVLLPLWLACGAMTGVSAGVCVALCLGFDLRQRWIYVFGIATGWLLGLLWLNLHEFVLPPVLWIWPTWISLSLNVWGVVSAVLWARGITGLTASSRRLAGILTLIALLPALLRIIATTLHLRIGIVKWDFLLPTLIYALPLAGIVGAVWGATHQRGYRFKLVQIAWMMLGVMVIALGTLVGNRPTPDEMRFLFSLKGGNPLLDVSADGPYLVAGTSDFRTKTAAGYLTVWDLTSNKQVLQETLEYPVHAIDISPNGREVAVGIGSISGPIRKFTWEEMRHFQQQDYQKQFDRWRVTSEGRAELWSLQQLSYDGSIDVYGHVSAVRYSPDGRSLATCSIAADEMEMQVELWDTSSRKKKHSIPFLLDGYGARIFGHTNTNQILFSPNSSLVGIYRASGSVMPYEVTFWSRNSDKWQQYYPLNQKITPSHDGRVLAGIGEKYIDLIDSQTGDTFYTLPNSPDMNPYQRCLAFSRDGKFLAVAGGENRGPNRHFAKIALWSMVESKFVKTSFLDENNQSILSVVFSPDGKRIYAATNQGAIYEWEIAH